VLLSRPVDDGFALVKVPKHRGVRVLANNQLSGRTGRRGSLFVPDLRSYLSSPIGIVQDDLPVEMKLGCDIAGHRGPVSRRRRRGLSKPQSSTR
jgi:outer membrane usher protein